MFKTGIWGVLHLSDLTLNSLEISHDSSVKYSWLGIGKVQLHILNTLEADPENFDSELLRLLIKKGSQDERDEESITEALKAKGFATILQVKNNEDSSSESFQVDFSEVDWNQQEWLKDVEELMKIWGSFEWSCSWEKWIFDTSLKVNELDNEEIKWFRKC